MVELRIDNSDFCVIMYHGVHGNILPSTPGTDNYRWGLVMPGMQGHRGGGAPGVGGLGGGGGAGWRWWGTRWTPWRRRRGGCFSGSLKTVQ